MHRIDALRAIKEEGGDALLICNIGDPSRELCSLGDAPNQFYMLGSMGLASSIGLGVAMAQPGRRVIAIDGDGAVLMNMGSLATIGVQGLSNLLLIIIDNGAYGSTGGQGTCTALVTDLAAVARGAGVKDVRAVDEESELIIALRSMRSGVLLIRVDHVSTACPNIELAPRTIADRFMAECQRPSR